LANLLFSAVRLPHAAGGFLQAKYSSMTILVSGAIRLDGQYLQQRTNRCEISGSQGGEYEDDCLLGF
jgi:hypothetical protein